MREPVLASALFVEFLGWRRGACWRSILFGESTFCESQNLNINVASCRCFLSKQMGISPYPYTDTTRHRPTLPQNRNALLSKSIVWIREVSEADELAREADDFPGMQICSFPSSFLTPYCLLVRFVFHGPIPPVPVLVQLVISFWMWMLI